VLRGIGGGSLLVASRPAYDAAARVARPAGRPPGPAARPGRRKSGMMADMSIGNGNSKRLVRTLDGRMVAGVCSGLAEYTGLEVTVVRLIFAAATFLGFFGAFAYIAAWVIIPEEGEKASIAEKFINKGNG
jgi:phage shock protein PspC (stress-responsive transcriptional regulator)